MTVPRYAFLHVSVDQDQVEDVSAELFARGALGIEERDQTTLCRAPAGVTLVASFPSEEETAAHARWFSTRFVAEVAFVEGDAWRDAWKKYFQVSRLGPRLVLAPSWERVEKTPEDVVVRMDPGRAFGSGIHETTRLVLRELDGFIVGGETVLDVGAGSGILSIAALCLGAAEATGLDIDPDTIAVAMRNAAQNQVRDRFSASTQPVEEVTREFSVVLANIEAAVLRSMAKVLCDRVAPGGRLILSGILAEQMEQVVHAYNMLPAPKVSREGEWIALSFHRGAR